MAGRRYLLTVIIIAGWLVLLTASSAAHSNLVRSDPPENAQLTTAPKQVQLWFSEAPELKLSDVQVVTPQRKRIDAGDLHLAPGDPTSLIISLRDTPVGTYAVIWQATSAVDGHITKGVFAFSYGNQPAGATESVLESLAVSS